MMLLLFAVEVGPFCVISLYFIFTFHFIFSLFRTSFEQFSLHFIAWVVVRGARGEEWEGDLGKGQGGDRGEDQEEDQEEDQGEDKDKTPCGLRIDERRVGGCGWSTGEADEVEHSAVQGLVVGAGKPHQGLGGESVSWLPGSHSNPRPTAAGQMRG